MAVTRAENKLFLSHASSRYRFGRLENNEPSRFIEEIDPSFIKTNQKFNISTPVSSITSSSDNSGYAQNLVRGLKRQQAQTKAVQSNYTPSSDFVPSDTSKLEGGMKVEHPKFGFGKVIVIEENGTNRKAKVHFDNFGEKTLLLSFAKLKIH